MSFEKYFGSSDYIAGNSLQNIVNVSIALQRPLLVKGEPGTPFFWQRTLRTSANTSSSPPIVQVVAAARYPNVSSACSSIHDCAAVEDGSSSSDEGVTNRTFPPIVYKGATYSYCFIQGLEAGVSAWGLNTVRKNNTHGEAFSSGTIVAYPLSQDLMANAEADNLTSTCDDVVQLAASANVSDRVRLPRER